MNINILLAVEALCDDTPGTSYEVLSSEYLRVNTRHSKDPVKILIHDDGDDRCWIGYEAGQVLYCLGNCIAPTGTELATAFDALKKQLLRY